MDKKSRGYLEEQFRLFYLTDHRAMKFDPHFHDFYKVLIHMTGHVTYVVDDKVYPLKPGDILFIPRYQVHYSEIGESSYERYILWISEVYLRRSQETEILLHCFELAANSGSYVFHPEPALFQHHLGMLKQLERMIKSAEYGAELYAETLLLQFMIEMNRLTLNETAAVNALRSSVSVHIEEAMTYINEHLEEDLTVDALAARLYISSSYLMHRFRQDTGLTLHQYILQKRLFTLVQALKPGENIGAAAHAIGFKDYSTFFRAFRRLFGKTPQEFLKKRGQPLKEPPLRE